VRARTAICFPTGVPRATGRGMSARHHLLDSPDLGRRAHVWSFGHVGQPLVVFPSNAGVAHEWKESGMIDALSPLLAAGRVKIYCPETNVSRSFSGSGSVAHRMAHHHAYERFVMNTLVPFIREDCRMPNARMTATGCSVGALYSSLFVLKHPETFHQALCLSGRYRASRLFDGQSSHDLYLNDPLAFLPNLHGGPLDRVRRQVHLTVVVGRGNFEEGCIPETAELGSLLKQKGIPHHLAFWGTESSHTYPWWQKQALHYLRQII
jgi:esterase/lipase superfamily enzyme